MRTVLEHKFGAGPNSGTDAEMGGVRTQDRRVTHWCVHISVVETAEVGDKAQQQHVQR